MAERLSFERRLAELQLPAAAAGECRVDYYDRVHPHLQYLGRLHVPAPRNRWQIRLVDRGRLKGIFSANRTKATATSRRITLSTYLATASKTRSSQSRSG